MDDIEMDLNPSSIEMDEKIEQIICKLERRLINSLDYKSNDDEVFKALHCLKKFRNYGKYGDLTSAASYSGKYISNDDRAYLYECSAIATQELYYVKMLVDYYAYNDFEGLHNFPFQGVPEYETLHDFDNFIKWVNFGISINSHRFKYFMAEMLLDGYGNIEKDVEKARDLLIQLLENESPYENDSIYANSHYAYLLSEIERERGEIVNAFFYLLKYDTRYLKSIRLEVYESKYLILFEAIRIDCVYGDTDDDPDFFRESDFSDENFTYDYAYYQSLAKILKNGLEEQTKHIENHNEYLCELYSLNEDELTEEQYAQHISALKIEYKTCIEFITSVKDSFLIKYGDFKFEKIDDYVMAKEYVGVNSEVVIPGTVEGLVVKKLGNNLFYKKSVRKVQIPNSVEEIGKYCFSKSELESIELPSKVKKLSRCAFLECSNLTSVALNDGLKEVDDFCFSKCSQLAEMYFNQTIERLGNNCFEYCDKLEHVSFHPSSQLQIIDGYCFSFCYSLSEISIPGTVFYIGGSSFIGCVNLKRVSFTTETNNHKLTCGICKRAIESGNICESCSERNNIDSIVEKLNLSYKSNNLYIKESSFMMCENLTEITLPDNLVYLGDYAFQECKSLNKIYLRETLTYVGYRVFKDCENLTIYLESDYSPGNWSYRWHDDREIEYEINEKAYKKLK